jgi:hypothetical protein
MDTRPIGLRAPMARRRRFPPFAAWRVMGKAGPSSVTRRSRICGSACPSPSTASSAYARPSPTRELPDTRRRRSSHQNSRPCGLHRMLTIDTGRLVLLSQGVSPVQFLGGRVTMRLPSRGRCCGGGILRERIERNRFDRAGRTPISGHSMASHTPAHECRPPSGRFVPPAAQVPLADTLRLPSSSGDGTRTLPAD